MAYAMGGRTAEEIVFHDPTTGASNDIEKATKIARTMVVEYGFSDKLGAIKWESAEDDQGAGMEALAPHKYSDEVARTIDDEVLDMVETAHTEAWQILNDNRAILDQLVRELLEKETLNEKELARIFAPVKKAPQRSVWLSNPDRPVSDVPPVEIPHELKKSAGIEDDGNGEGSNA
jgi:cell division protease FtsH